MILINPFVFGAAPTDPDFASVSILLPLNGSNGGTSIPDVSTFAHSMSTDGTTNDAQYKWGGSSYLSNAVAQITCTAGSEFSYTADFSIEVWVYFTATSADQYLFDHGSNETVLIINPATGNVHLYHGASIINTGATPFSTGQWYFMQVVRSGSTITIGRDGSTYATATNSSTLGKSTGTFTVGSYAGGTASAYGPVGHLQDFRITKGVARPIAVPTAAFPTS